MRVRVLLRVIGVWVGTAGLVSCGGRTNLVYDVNAAPHNDAAPREDANDAGDEDVCTGPGCDGPVCSAGPCCTGGLASCAGVCIDVQTSSSNCGACGVVCPEVAMCLQGKCVCPTATHDCGGSCVSDDSVGHCGASCGPCPSPPNSVGVTCDGVTCDFACISGFTVCDTTRADLQTDPQNCGACAHDCFGGACDAGVCQPVVLTTGQPDILFLAIDASTGRPTTGPS
jgi:hypothetical protein